MRYKNTTTFENNCTNVHQLHMYWKCNTLVSRSTIQPMGLQTIALTMYQSLCTPVPSPYVPIPQSLCTQSPVLMYPFPSPYVPIPQSLCTQSPVLMYPVLMYPFPSPQSLCTSPQSLCTSPQSLFTQSPVLMYPVPSPYVLSPQPIHTLSVRMAV